MSVLYFKNVSADNEWDNVLNWFEAIEADGAPADIQASAVPWTDDNVYKDWDLTRSPSDAGDDVNISYGQIGGGGFDVTGTCDISYLYPSGTFIYSGTFSGHGVSIADFGYAYIYGGTFTGDYFYLGFDNLIYGGTFTGDYFTNGEQYNGGGAIYGGVFTGNSFTNYGQIYGGVFSGDNFYNSAGLYSGILAGDGFQNDGSGGGGFWLLKGSIKVGGVVIKGRYANPEPDRFMSITVASDIIGGGLL